MRNPARRQLLWRGLALAGLGLLSGCAVPPPWARQALATRRIGFLSGGSPAGALSLVEALRQGLRDLGHLEGRDIVIEPHHAEGRDDRLAALAAELVGLGMDAIVTSGTPAALAAKHATEAIPIVSVSGDPVETGLIASLARPGGNVTGLTLTVEGRSAKKLELLKEAVPGLSRVMNLGNGGNPAHATALRELQEAAPRLGVQVQAAEVRGADDIEPAFRAGTAGRADGLFVQDDPLTFASRAQILDSAAKHRLPAMYGRREWVEAGGLMFYGVDFAAVYRRAAAYVDKILRGAKPADLPVEQPTTFDLVVNLKTARALGLTIPQSVLLQATEVLS